MASAGRESAQVCVETQEIIVNKILIEHYLSGSVIESFQFGIVKVCVNGNIELRRKQDVANDVTLRGQVKLGGGDLINYHSENLF